MVSAVAPRSLAGAAGAIAWTAMAGLLVLRRLAVEWQGRSALEIAVVALCVLAGTSLARAALFGLAPQRLGAGFVRGPLALTPGLVLLAFWLSTFAAGAAAVVLVWLLVALHEAAWVATSVAADPPAAGPSAADARPARDAATAASGGNAARGGGPLLESDDERTLPPEETQRILRSRIDGVEHVSGLLRADFAAGQQTAAVYAGFCPPLLPEAAADVEVAEGEATAKVVQVDPEGIQVEVRRRGAIAAPGEAIVEFVARATVGSGEC